VTLERDDGDRASAQRYALQVVAKEGGQNQNRILKRCCGRAIFQVIESQKASCSKSGEDGLACVFDYSLVDDNYDQAAGGAAALRPRVLGVNEIQRPLERLRGRGNTRCF